MGHHESPIELCVADSQSDNRSACRFQIGLASSRRCDENPWESKTKIAELARHSRGSGRPNQKHLEFYHVGWKHQKLRSWGEFFLLDFPVYRTARTDLLK